jgi:hypothetical protein
MEENKSMGAIRSLGHGLDNQVIRIQFTAMIRAISLLHSLLSSGYEGCFAMCKAARA